MMRLALPDGHLAYRDEGTGRPVVLLHGGGLDHRMWDRLVDDLAAEYRVLAPDARGHGRSATPTGPFRHCDDVAALLRLTGPATLVGLSMGGGTAVDTALEHPDLVHALVVCGVGTSEPDFRDPWVLDVFATWVRTQAAGDAEGWTEAFLQFVPGPQRRLDDVDPDVVTACRVMVADLLATHVRLDPTTGTPVPPILPVPVRRTWERLPQLTVPVLAVNGALDSDDHLRMGERLAREVPDGGTAIVDGAAHYPNMERPEEFHGLVASFLQRTTPPPAAAAAAASPGAG